MIKIREACKSEAKSLSGLAMRSKAHWGYSAEFMEACRQELLVTEEMIASKDNHYAVADAQGVVVGFYSLISLSKPNIELGLLFIEPSHIGTGIGRTLITHAKNHAIASGGRTLHFQGDPNAEAFYKAIGATLTGKRESSSIPERFLPTFSISLSSEGVA